MASGAGHDFRGGGKTSNVILSSASPSAYEWEPEGIGSKRFGSESVQRAGVLRLRPGWQLTSFSVFSRAARSRLLPRTRYCGAISGCTTV